MRFLVTLLLALMPVAAFGQGAVLQAGPVVPGHFVSWTRNGQVQDSGLAIVTGPFMPLIGVTRTVSAPPGPNYAPFRITDTFDFSGDTFAAYNPNLFTMNVEGQITGNGNELYTVLNLLGKHSSDWTDAGASEWSAFQSQVIKTPPGSGYDSNGAPEGWSIYTPYANNDNLPSSVSGADNLSETDMWQTNLDDKNTRFGHQTSIFQQNGAFYTADIGNAYLLQCFIACGDMMNIGGAFETAAMDFRFASATDPVITSATPGSSVRSVVVNNVVPLAHGGHDVGGGVLLGGDSTAAVTGITATAAGGTLLAVGSVSGAFAGQSGVTAYITNGMYVYDLTTPGAVPALTTIVGASGNFSGNGIPASTTLSLSASTTVAAGDSLLFARGQKQVKIHGDVYTVSGITMPTMNSPSGTVYFTSPVTVADATNGVAMVPNAHTLWMWEGNGSTVPAGDIAFNRSGSMTLSCADNTCFNLAINGGGLNVAGILDVNNTATMSAGGGWSFSNWGKQLLLTTPTGLSSPALAFTDASGGNWFGIADGGGTLQFATMPPYSNSTTPGNIVAQMNDTAVTLGSLSTVVVVQSMPVNCTGHGTGTLWNNAGVVNVCP